MTSSASVAARRLGSRPAVAWAPSRSRPTAHGWSSTTRSTTISCSFRERWGTEVVLVDDVSRYVNASMVRPAWSPDGTQIAFAASSVDEHPGGSGLYVINADGTGFSRVPMKGRCATPPGGRSRRGRASDRGDEPRFPAAHVGDSRVLLPLAAPGRYPRASCRGSGIRRFGRDFSRLTLRVTNRLQSFCNPGAWDGTGMAGSEGGSGGTAGYPPSPLFPHPMCRPRPTPCRL